MLEIEAKLRVDSHEPVRQRLRELSASFIGRYREENHILDRPDGSLRTAGCGLRVRAMETLEGRAAPATMTYKGPRQPGPLKRRDEIEVTISDAPSCLRMLQALDFETVLVYSKLRERWALSDCRIELDEVPQLGRFVEIEGPSEPAIRAAQDSLRLSQAPHESRSYPHMLLQG